MDPRSFTTVEYAEREGVAWVTLNRPSVHNALSEQMRDELRRIWLGLRSEPNVRCVVVTGAGFDAFTSGIDRTEILPDDDPGFDPFSYNDMAAELGPKTSGLWKPVIAAVNGMAYGAAFYLLGEADFIIASEHATFCDPHLTYGMPAVYEPIFLSGRMPFGDLARMTLLGLAERMSAATARACGLVSEVVPGGELTERARWAAETIAGLPSAPVQATVRALWTARRLGVPAAIEMANPMLATGMRGELMRAGQDRFRNRARSRARTR